MNPGMNPDWLTPSQLAAELGRPARWVEEHMASGDIPSVRLGRFRYFTPECRARLVAAQLSEPAEVEDSWGRPTGRRSA